MNLKASLANKRLFIIVFLFFCISVFSQKLEGTYLDALPGSSSVTSITFKKNGSFKYSTGSDMGNIDYGKGNFVLTNNKLSLFFSNDLPLKEYGNHRVHYWKSLSDSIIVNFVLAEDDILPLANIHIIVFMDTILMGGVSIPEGEKKVQMKLPKKEGNKFYNAIINRIGYEPFVFHFHSDFNQDISFNIIKTDHEFGMPIISEVLIFEVLDRTKQVIKVRNKDGKIINWSKID
ncbi:MAG: hypothetical protein U1C58_11320 [Flavobacteriaceae bacterium]|nr:hypothetical protein [Flavobacteriaceae bacterium]